ncbi:hypothetical protein [Oceanobacillus chungangensis]|uniref:Uncharacterized protein n=1 Tax=Oceanobacillus chungangensis TaxID=1229152 RepID=A0A3D8PU35_9BACI|nr:hypothetical protein [Oceanobacillus chungangensis]RDW18768.1 hypothetical protein CWR45_09240 [Oceanobacillus chungangensis]
MKDILKHPTISSIIGTVVGTAIATPIVAYINKVNVLEAFILIFNWLKNVLITLLAYQVSIWIILFVLFIYLLFKKVLIHSGSSIEHSNLTHYRKDTIDNILWIFEWYEGFDRKLSLTNSSPHPICPNCMNDLVVSSKSSNGYYSPHPTYLICDNCGFSQKFGNDFDDYRIKVQREIIRRVRTGEWKKTLTKEQSS